MDDNVAALPGLFGRSSNTETRLGWTAGIGAEYALGRNWSLRGEYRYADFGQVKTRLNVRNPNFAGLNDDVDSTVNLDTHTLLIGVTYRFSGL